MEVGVYGVHFPPFELGTGAAVGAEAAGMDFIIYGDQLCFTHPTSLWTPDITDVAALLPTFNAFMDAGPIIAAAAAQTSTIKYHYGVIDAVRRPPSVIAQSVLTLDHATKGRVHARRSTTSSSSGPPRRSLSGCSHTWTSTSSTSCRWSTMPSCAV